MTKLSADKRGKPPPVAAAGENTVGAMQDVFAHQEDLFTVISTDDDR